MTRMEMVRRCEIGYRKGFADGSLTDLVDSTGRPLKTMPRDSDTLGVFVVHEINTVFVDGDTDDNQLNEVACTMTRWSIDLTNIAQQLLRVR